MKFAFAVLAVFCVLLSCSSATSVTSYDNDALLKVNISTPEQLEALSLWIDKINSHLSSPNSSLPIDIWTSSSLLVLGSNDILVASSHLHQFHSILSLLSISSSVKHANIQELIDNQFDTKDSKLDNFWDTYHRYDAIRSETERLCSSRPNLCRFIPQVATSIQGRSIVGIALRHPNLPANARQVWLQGGQHAREWVGPATVMYIMDRFITLAESDPTIRQILSTVEIFIIPSVNPDGYEFSWTTTRLWRKNRRLNTGGSYGVDLNRNWADHWGGGGSSGVPTSDTYRGTAPFSEPESSGVSSYMKNFAPRSIVAIDYHSYSQLILRPFSWGTAIPPNNGHLLTAGNGMVSTIRATPNGVPYTNQAGYELYVASGGAHDWFFTEVGAKFSFTIELRDTGFYGFTLPASLIYPTALENWNALVWAIQYAIENP